MRRTDQDTLTIHDLVHIADQITKHYLMRTVRERKRRVEGREGGREGRGEGGRMGGKEGEREDGRERGREGGRVTCICENHMAYPTNSYV